MDKQKAGVIIPALLLATWMPGCSSAGTDSDPTGLPLPTSSTTLVVSTTALPTTTGPTTSTTSVTAAKPPRWVRPDVCQGPCHPALEVLFTIPVGDDSGVGYRNVDQEETFPSGPSAIALDEEGHVWVADAVNRRILGYSRRGAPIATIDLTPYDVASAVDLAAGPNGFLLLDIYVAMERYRLHELDPSGGLLATHDLPKGLHFEDGLTGVSMGPEGELWIELEGGARIADLDVGEDSVGFTISPGYSYPNGTYGPVAGDPFAYQTPDIAVDVTTTAEFGGLTMLSVNPDRSFVLQLDEVTLDATGAFQVNQTIHLFDHDGYHLGETGFRVAEQFAGVEHPLVVAPDGNTYALMTRRDHVAIARLPYGTGEEFGPDWRQTV